jgi:predicted PurR-regulated permease PerM
MATAALFLWIIPLVGLIVGIAAYVRSRRVGKGAARAITGIVLSVVIAGLAVFLVPKLIKASDPGCTYFKGTALSTYNSMVGDLNSGATQSTLSGEVTTTISQLTTAENDAQNSSVRSSLATLIGELGVVQKDVAGGSVPKSVISALNNDADATDNACGTI